VKSLLSAWFVVASLLETDYKSPNVKVILNSQILLTMDHVIKLFDVKDDKGRWSYHQW